MIKGLKFVYYASSYLLSDHALDLHALFEIWVEEYAQMDIMLSESACKNSPLLEMIFRV